MFTPYFFALVAEHDKCQRVKVNIERYFTCNISVSNSEIYIYSV